MLLVLDAPKTPREARLNREDGELVPGSGSPDTGREAVATEQSNGGDAKN